MGWLIGLPLKAYLYAGIVLLVVGLSLAVKIQTSRLDAEKAAFSAFKAQVEVLGQAAKKEAARVNLVNLEAKKRADDENAKTKRDLSGVYAAYRSLRDSRTAGGGVSQAPTFTPSSDRTCFDSTSFVGAMGRFEAGMVNILEKGDSAIADLNTARIWSQAK